MNTSTSCDRLWRKRLSELEHVWPDLLDGNPGGLHKARVATRRIREALPIVAVAASAPKVKKVSKKMRALTRYLGPVRELDVELEILEDKQRPVGASERVIETVYRAIAERRQALRDELVDNLPVSDVKKLLRKLEKIGRKNGDERETQWRGALATRLMRRAKSLAATLHDAGPLYAPERLHAVRVSTKKLRYALEVAHELGVAGAAVLVRMVKRHQERLGQLHDLQMLLKHVRETVGSSGSQTSELTAYAESLDKACRRLHADFVEHRDELANVVKQVRQQVVPALTTQDRRLAHASGDRPSADSPSRFSRSRQAAHKPRAR